MDWMVLLKVFVTLLALVGALAVILGLPGTFIAWLGLLIYALIGRFTVISAWILLGTFAGCLVVELADNLLSGFLVKRFGAGTGRVLYADGMAWWFWRGYAWWDCWWCWRIFRFGVARHLGSVRGKLLRCLLVGATTTQSPSQ